MMALMICPIAFGVIIANLKEDISDISNTRVTTGNATVFPPSDITCVTWPSSISKKTSNVTSFRVNGNMSAALDFQTKYNAMKPEGSKKCTCTQDSLVNYTHINGTAATTTNNDTIIECSQGVEWQTRTITAFLYWNDNESYTIDYQSPKKKIAFIQNDINGFFVGIFLCVGILGFLLIGTCLHFLCSRKRDKVCDTIVASAV